MAQVIDIKVETYEDRIDSDYLEQKAPEDGHCHYSFKFETVHECPDSLPVVIPENERQENHETEAHLMFVDSKHWNMNNSSWPNNLQPATTFSPTCDLNVKELPAIGLGASEGSYDGKHIKVEIESLNSIRKGISDESNINNSESLNDIKLEFTHHVDLGELILKQEPEFDINTEKQGLKNERIKNKSNIVDSKKNFKKRCRKKLNCDSKKIYTCHICGKTFFMKRWLRRHVFNHSGLKLHKCSTCNKAYYDAGSLKVHELVHLNMEPYTCTECGKTFSQPRYLTKHLLFHREKINVCTICQKAFTDGCSLRRHMKIHAKVKPFTCVMCNKSYREQTKLKKHMLLHSGLDHFECTKCQKTLESLNSLKRHERSHLDVKQYKCDQCEKAYHDYHSYKRHCIIHTSGKAHACDKCGKRFCEKGNLKRHLHAHDGNKPFQCMECGKTFAQAKTLSLHMKIHYCL